MQEQVQICPPSALKFADHSRPIYKATGSSVEEIGAHPSGMDVPGLVFNRAGALIQGGYKWSANLSHLFYDVLSDFLVGRCLMTHCAISIAPSDLARKVLALLDAKMVQGVWQLTRGDDYSDGGKLAYLHNLWRFSGQQHPYISHLIRKSLYPAVQPAPKAVLVIHRKPSSGQTYSRSFANCDEMVQTLKQHGLPAVKVVLEDLPLQAQLSLFAHALGVISTHGSGLFWLNFCRAGTPVVEITPPYFRASTGVKPDFWYISLAHGLKHVCCVCEDVVGDADSPTDHDLVVEPAVLRQLFGFHKDESTYIQVGMR